jgi:hypothetical protein
MSVGRPVVEEDLSSPFNPGARLSESQGGRQEAGKLGVEAREARVARGVRHVLDGGFLYGIIVRSIFYFGVVQQEPL